MAFLSNPTDTTSTFKYPFDASLSANVVVAIALGTSAGSAESFHLQFHYLALVFGRSPVKECFLMTWVPDVVTTTF